MGSSFVNVMLPQCATIVLFHDPLFSFMIHCLVNLLMQTVTAAGGWYTALNLEGHNGSVNV